MSIRRSQPSSPRQPRQSTSLLVGSENDGYRVIARSEAQEIASRLARDPRIKFESLMCPHCAGPIVTGELGKKIVCFNVPLDVFPNSFWELHLCQGPVVSNEDIFEEDACTFAMM